MTVQQYLEVTYAASNRIRCQNCGQTIQKDELKIGHVFVRRPAARYDKKVWYHIGCLTTLPRGDRNQELDIVNIHNLKQADQQRIKDKFKELRANGYQKKNQKEGKFLTKQEHYNTFVKGQTKQFFANWNLLKNTNRMDYEI